MGMQLDDTEQAKTYQNKLSERTSDGGGCTETWETLSEIRDGDNKSTQSRRNFITAIATAVVGFGFVDSVEAATEAVDVSRPEGAEKNKILKEALSDSRVKKLRQEFISMGYRPRVNDARVVTSELNQSKLQELNANHRNNIPDEVTDEGKWEGVVIPFGPTDEEDVYVTWSSASNIDQQVVGRRWTQIVPDDAEAYYDIENYTVEPDGSITVTEEEVPNFLGCDDVNTGCVLVVASAYASLFVACFTCGYSAGVLIPACAYCLIAIFGSSGAAMTCDWCND